MLKCYENISHGKALLRVGYNRFIQAHMYNPLSKVGKTSRRFLAGVLLFGALVWVSLNVWTAPVGMVWHLFHGNSTSFDGHRVDVPWDMWIHRPADQTLMIVREAPKYPILRSTTGIILIQRIPGRATDMSKDYDRIARTNERARNGYQFQEVHRLTTAKGYGYCWELVRFDSSYLSISCRFDNDTLDAAYEGSPAYRKEFYKAIETVSGRVAAP